MSMDFLNKGNEFVSVPIFHSQQSFCPLSNFSVTMVSSKPGINRLTEDAKLERSHQAKDRSKLAALYITQKHDVKTCSVLIQARKKKKNLTAFKNVI